VQIPGEYRPPGDDFAEIFRQLPTVCAMDAAVTDLPLDQERAPHDR
jgi:hypothetical protein